MVSENLKPYVAAFASFVVVMFAGLTVGGLEYARTILAEREATAAYAETVIHEAAATLLKAVRDVGPRCDELGLRRLRLLEYESRYVNDIAVLDAGGKVVCSSTLGALAGPQPAFHVDYSIVLEGQQVDVYERAGDYLAGGNDLLTTARLGRLQITLASHAIERMRSERFTAVGILTPGGGSHINRGTLKDEGDQAAMDELARMSMDWGGNGRAFNWRHLAMESHYKVQGMPFFYFQRAYLFASAATSMGYKIVLTLAAFAVAMLVHATLEKRVRARGQMRYRIKHLLNEANLRTVYQPVVDLRTHQIVGCEVLVRLQDGATLLTPDRFLQDVVERGLGWELDRLVITRALGELHAVLPKGEPFEISLNLFPQNVKSEALGELILGHLGWTQSPGRTINLEIIEHEYKDEMLIEIEALKRMGFKVCVDDFGTGYSNLGSVKKIKPDFLKIDRSFVFDMELSTVRSSLIPEIVSIARATGAAVIAEGIEKEGQVETLAEQGVEYGQGYFLGKPMSASALMARIDLQPRKVIDLEQRRHQMASAMPGAAAEQG